MSLPLYLTSSLDGAGPGSRLELTGEEGRHAATVRRTRVGERLEVADGRGTVAVCLVEGTRKDGLDLTVQEIRVVERPRPALVLVQALAKGGRDEQAVETATEYGVDVVVPWQARRSVVRWEAARVERGLRRWESTVWAAAKQSRRADVPVVASPMGTDDLVRALGRDADRGGARLGVVLHEEAQEPLSAVDLSSDVAEIWLVVGPEGGIGVEELAELTGAGAVAARLGPQVLRSSSAGPAGLAVLSTRLGRW